MQKEDYNSIKTLEGVLEADLRRAMAKVNTAGTINPTEVKTLTDAVCLMLKLKEYQQWMEGPEGEEQMRMMYSQRMSPMSYNPYYHSYTPMMQGGYEYPNQPSNHSTKDRMISRLEDMMGDAKNEYEAKMIRDAITYIQSN